MSTQILLDLSSLSKSRNVFEVWRIQVEFFPTQTAGYTWLALPCAGVPSHMWGCWRSFAELPCRLHCPSLAREVWGDGGWKFLPAGTAGKRLPCLCFTLKYVLRTPLMPENAVLLDGNKSIYKNPSLPSNALYITFMHFCWPQCYIQFLHNSCIR